MDCPRVAAANLVSQSYWENFTQNIQMVIGMINFEEWKFY